MRLGVDKFWDILNCRDSDKKINDRKLSECKDVNFILNFPTGYGKTTLSLTLAKYLKENVTTTFSRIIHVVPTKTLIWDIEEKAREAQLSYGVQYSFAPSETKTPNFLADFVITTYDSFLMNLFKGSVGEPFSVHGHYDIPRFSIFTSIVHFDEYHLMREGNSWASLLASVSVLARHGVNMILSSASSSKAIDSEIVKNIAKWGKEVVKIEVVRNFGDAEKKYNCREIGERGEEEKDEIREYECDLDNDINFTLVEIADKEFRTPYVPIEVIKKEKLEEIVNAHKDEKILIVMNTVDGAIEVYEKLKQKYEDVSLIHSRFKEKDKRGKGFKRIVVATQVIEVGVNLDYDVLITEQAPIFSLVQRAGRILRNREGEGRIYIIEDDKYYPYSKEEVERTMNEIKGKNGIICFKHPYGCGNAEGYSEIIERVYNTVPFDYKQRELYDKLTHLDFNFFSTKQQLKEILSDYCSLTDSFVVSLATEIPKSHDDLISVDGDYFLRSIEDQECVKAFFEKFSVDEGNGVDTVTVVEDCFPRRYLRDRRCLCSNYTNVFVKKGNGELTPYYGNGKEKYMLVAFHVDPRNYNEELGLRL
ncbi:RNA helicase [Sulfolobus acidocaldarius SUSAZ]|nr:RNA helicase [Sulfolobus acidocaldarius SUSAZ]